MAENGRSVRRALTPIRIRRHDKSIVRPKSLMLRGLRRVFKVSHSVLCGQETEVPQLMRISLIIVRPQT